MTTPESAYHDFHQHLSRYIQRRLGSADDVPDILHEVFVRVLRNEVALNQAREPLAWLYTVTKSVIIDHYRKSERKIDMAIEPPPEEPDLLASDFGTCIAPLLDNLPDKYRDALRYTDRDGGHQTEYAAESGQNLSAVKSQVQRGRRMLKDAIIGCCKIDFDINNRVIDVYPDAESDDDCC